jgi:poly-gamma-glutamate synthesis protein (capsule biosynthesis protein)
MNIPRPLTPYEVLDISSNLLKIILHTIVNFARLLGLWKFPYKKAATDLEEIGLLDMCYWVHKTTNPILKPEKEKSSDFQLLKDKSIVKLPEGFEEENSLTFSACGDLIRSKTIEESKDILFQNVADILFDQTISYTNFECPITNKELQEEIIGDKAPPTECCSKKHFDIFKGHKNKTFTIMNTANNHMFDMGVEGIENTQKHIQEAGIIDVGTNSSKNEYGKGKIITKEGIKVGFASVTFGINGHKMPKDDVFRLNISQLMSKFSEPDLSLLQSQIDDCKKNGCDFIIASLHWGYEFEFFPRNKQIEAARKAVEMGADLIVSHHPHVIQPVEYYRTKRDPNRVAVISYSLGTMAWGFTAPHLALSAILKLRISKGKLDDKSATYIKEADIIPVFRGHIDKNGQSVMCIEKLEDHAKTNSPYPKEYINKMNEYAELILD